MKYLRSTLSVLQTATARWVVCLGTCLLSACGGGGGGGTGTVPTNPSAGTTSPAPDTPVATTTAADCAPTGYMTEGSNWQLTYKQVAGLVESQSSIDSIVNTGQTFNGVSGLVKISQFNVLRGARTDSGIASYQKLVDGKIMEYGTQSGSPTTLVTRVYDEPADQAQWRLTSAATTHRFNTPYTEYSVTGARTRSVSAGTWTYQGQEAHRVTAGNFRTCYLTLTTADGATTTDYWFLRGKGVMVASRITDNATRTVTYSTELVSGAFNGVTLTGDAP